MTTCTTCGCAPLNRLSVISIPIISYFMHTVPGHVQCMVGGGGGGGGGGWFTGDVGSVANS